MTAYGMNKLQRQFRDVQAAQDVGKKAELGWLDVEFTMYGCAYLDTNKDLMQYKVSSKAEDIYAFMERSKLADIYPSNLEKMTWKCPVPTGTQHLIERELKKELARELRNLYPRELFEKLYLFSETNNSAAKVLWDEAEALEGVFSEERLKEFEKLVAYAYRHRVLAKQEYEKFLGWLKEERANMDDDIVSKEILQKTLYGILYEENGTGLKSLSNARKETICKKAIDVEIAGGFVTPIYERAYGYTADIPIASLNKLFREELQKKEQNYEVKKIRDILLVKNETKKIEFQNELEVVRTTLGEKAATTMQWYGFQWGIL